MSSSGETNAPYTFGLGPKSEHVIEAGDGKGGKVVVKNSSDSVVAVAISGDDATLTFEVVEATRMADLPHVKLGDKVLLLRKKNHDPTAEDMMNLLIPNRKTHTTNGERDEYNSACIAIYWYALLHHEGKGTNLLAALQASDYRPTHGVMMSCTNNYARSTTDDGPQDNQCFDDAGQTGEQSVRWLASSAGYKCGWYSVAAFNECVGP